MTEKSLHLRGPTPNVQFIMMLSYHVFNTFLPGKCDSGSGGGSYQKLGGPLKACPHDKNNAH